MASPSTDLNNGSCSTSTSDVVGLLHRDVEEGPILIRLLSHRDVFPMILGYLDIRSLLALSSITTRFRREILMPATPNLCCINIFLQRRTIICPMSQFESLKDFMAKYRSFKPLHLHFTYSARSSLMSLVPEVSAPIYNSKVDTSFAHPSSSPLTTSHLFGVNQSISINITSTNSLYQYHHPLQQDQQQQPHRQLQLIHTQHENDQPETASSSHSSSLTSTSTLTGSSLSTKQDPSTAAQLTAGTDTRFNATRTSSSSSTSTDNDNFESPPELGRRGTTASAATEPNGKVIDLETKTTAMSIDRTGSGSGTGSGSSSGTGSGSGDIPSTAATTAANMITAAKSISDVAESVQYQQQQLQQQLYNSRFVNYYSNNNNNATGSTSSSSSSSNHTPNHTHRGGLLDLHSSILSDSIPVLSSSTSSITPPVSGHHGFELSYWQKFALNELFMRLLPFLRTLTIGRTDKASRRDRDEDPNKTSGELSAGVCFFLARCFNVMHDMPDTALEAVLWMDVTPKDVVLLTTMIELRDIMVDERYWKRGYWAVDRPGTCSNGHDGSQAGYYDEDDEDEEEEDDEGDWDGFYYLMNQEGSERRPSQQLKKKSSLPFMNVSSIGGGGKSTLRKSNTVRASSSSSSSSSSASNSPATSPFSKQTIAPLSSQQQVSGLGHLVKNASSTSTSSSSAPVTTASSPARGHNGTIKKGARSVVQSPAAWQGFSEGILDTSSSHSVNNTLYAEEDALPPAVQLFEVLKQEINEVGSVPRFISKSRQAFTSDPWPANVSPREA